MQDEIYARQHGEVGGVEGVEQRFELISAPPAAVCEQQRQRKQAKKLHRAQRYRKGDKIEREQQPHHGGIVQRCRALLPGPAEVGEAHARGQQHARNAVIDVHGRKTAQPHSGAERAQERRGAQHGSAYLPHICVPFESVERIYHQAGERKRYEYVRIYPVHRKRHDQARGHAAEQHERKVLCPVPRVGAALAESEGEQRH